MISWQTTLRREAGFSGCTEAGHNEHTKDKKNINKAKTTSAERNKIGLNYFFEIMLHHSTFQHYLCALLLFLLAQMVLYP